MIFHWLSGAKIRILTPINCIKDHKKWRGKKPLFDVIEAVWAEKTSKKRQNTDQLVRIEKE